MVNIIDIGSNSVRLFDGTNKTIVTTRLAHNMRGDILDAHSMEVTAAAVADLWSRTKGKCYAFATEAVRKASNKEEFLKLVFSRTGLNVDVIDGDAEAEISYLGATRGLPKAATVIDLGGASCELIFGDEKGITYKRSFPFGCVMLTDKFGDDLNGITRFVLDLLHPLPGIRPDLRIAVGGTATSLAAMAGRLEVYDPRKTDGYFLSAKTIVELIGALGKTTFPTLDANRKKTIAQGATALCAVMRALNADGVIISESDNLEGYAIKHNLI